jgi:threonine/homoserine/homoserine lactone efflux protein
MTGFIVLAVLVIVAPGPDFALTLRNTLRGGAQATAAGVAAGQLVWALATAAGVAALLVASHPAFVTLRMVGAGYLLWLGATALLGRRRHAHAPQPGSPFRQGLLSNLANPKMPVFFTSLLPQFGASFGALAVHGIIFAALTLVWLTAVGRVGVMLVRPKVRRAVEVVTGVVLVALGLRVATERR